MKTTAGRIFFHATRLDTVTPPPPGCDLDPYRDCHYSQRDFATMADAVAYAAVDYYECGRVEKRRLTDLPGISEEIAVWEVAPDGTTSLMDGIDDER